MTETQHHGAIDPAAQAVLSRQHFDAVIFDLDGVLTKTQQLHAQAWKQAFDDFRHQQIEAGADPFEPFEIDTDYYRHIDGVPRYEGISNFLHARGLSLPRGEAGDPPDAATVCGIGNRKNEKFLELLEKQGPERFESSFRFIEELRRADFKTAVVSASRNCVRVLAAAGALELFDAKIDGNDVEDRSLAGKPAPDIFRAAVRELGVTPRRSVAVEDATAGVQAAHAAGIGEIIGVDRGSGRASLSEHGADIVVGDLAEVTVQRAPDADSARLAPALIEDVERRIGAREPVFFLDFDGTLTPIVSRPGAAFLQPAMRHTLTCVSERFVTAVISGRDLDDLKSRTGLKNLIYAGSHGLDIQLPDGTEKSPESAHAALPALREAARHLEAQLGETDEILIENKKFAIAVHYRNVPESHIDEIERAVDDAFSRHGELRKRTGKQIFELVPDIDWDKGEAVRWLLDALELDVSSTVPVYIGDGVTDEDAFAVVHETGIGLAVNPGNHATNARYSIADIETVRSLLNWFCRRVSDPG